MLQLTNNDIREDIRGFEQRIQIAREKLAVLPEGYLPYLEHKKREKVRRACEDEVKHCQQLMVYAYKGIVIRQT